MNVIFLLLLYSSVHIHLCTCAGKRPTSGVDPQEPSTLFLESNSFIRLELTKKARLAGH